VGDDEYGEVWILDIFAPPRSTPSPSSSAAEAGAAVAGGGAA
jgi:hypothetical protein